MATLKGNYDLTAGLYDATSNHLFVNARNQNPRQVLEIRPDSNVQAMPRGQGTAVIFPSFVLHRVTPVTQGTRWSLTLWSHGPAFR